MKGRELHRVRRLALLFAAIVVPGLAPRVSQAGYISVSTHNPFLHVNDTATYNDWFLSPASAAFATITWQAGTNYIAGVAYGPTRFGPEAKFAGPPLAGRTFTGFGHLDGPAIVPPAVTTHGAGTSSTVPVFRFIPYSASWKLWAGYNDAGGTARCYGIAYGYDPWPIFPAAFAQDTLSTFDLYVPLGMLEGSAGGADSVGRFEYAVNYVTAQDTTHLLDVRVTEGYVQATSPDHPPGLAFYMIGSQDTMPTTAPANLLSLGGIRSALQSRMQGYGFTDPLVIGVFWPNVQVPTTFIRDTTLAEVEVNTSIELGTQGTISAVPTASARPMLWLAPPVPNPMGPAVKLRFTQARDAEASLAIYDVRGRLVRQLMNAHATAGQHVASWDGRSAAGHHVSPGVYFVKLVADGRTLTRRLVLLK